MSEDRTNMTDLKAKIMQSGFAGWLAFAVLVIVVVVGAFTFG